MPEQTTYEKNQIPIKAWAEEDRPREKMSLKGRQSLTDAELLAILLGSGTRDETAVALAQRILADMNNDLLELSRLSLSDLKRFRGVGEAKAITIMAALELGRRRQLSPLREKPQVQSSRDAFDAIGSQLADLLHEEFWILCMNRANRILSRDKISSGGVAGTVVDAKLVFRRAIDQNASAIILVHNHPSGSRSPSQADLELTRKLVQVGKALDLLVLDHLIITNGGYYSFADEGVL